MAERAQRALQIEKNTKNWNKQLQIKKTTSSIWQHERCKCSQHNQIKKCTANTHNTTKQRIKLFIWLCCEHLQHLLSNWWRCFLDLLVLFLFACVFWSCSALSSLGHRIMGPYHTPGTMQHQARYKCFLLVSARRSYNFHVLHHVVYIANAFAPICAPMGVLVWKRGVFRRIVGSLLFWGTEINRAIDQLKTWSKVNGAVCFFFCYLKSALVIYRRVHNARTLCLLHTQGCAAAHKHVKY